MGSPTMSPARRGAFIRETKGIEIPFFGVAENSSETPFAEKYHHLTTRQYRVFMDSYRGPGSESMDVSFGFRVVGNLLAQVPIAYAEHLRSANERPNLPELQGALHAAFKANVAHIAAMDRDRAARYETWLGLRDGQDPLGTSTAYRFVRWRERLSLEPKMANLDELDGEVASLNRDRGSLKEVGRGCPALTFILPKLWGIEVDGCITDADYFRTDIATVSAEVQ